jgi:hypothetical protein
VAEHSATSTTYPARLEIAQPQQTVTARFGEPN